MRSVMTLFDLTTPEIEQVFDRAEVLKQAYMNGTRDVRFGGRVMALLFEKPSLRTRVSFEAGFAHLGGTSLYLGSDVGWGRRESVTDFARVLGQYVDVVVCRDRDHGRVEQLAKHASCPVINGLTSRFHPCQALTDLFTMKEHFKQLKGLRLAYVGDANNVARSLAIAAARLDVRFTVASPVQYQFDAEFVKRMGKTFPDFELRVTTDPAEAVRGADAVYTDVWTSMGQEQERRERAAVLAPFQVNAELMAAASNDAVFMHCLPAHRGEEVTDDVIDSPQSIVVQQAANRLHLQKGLVAWLLSAIA
ncbi:MAG: ornithine carbamoyltransferase [Planctomycetota bacterium]